MTLKILGLLTGAALVLSANPITFTGISATTAPPSFSSADITFNNSGTAPGGGGGDNCSTNDCSFTYNNDNAGYLFTIATQTGDPGLLGLNGGIGVLSGSTITAGQPFSVSNITNTSSGQSAHVAIPTGTEFIINDGLGTATSDFFTAGITSLDLRSQTSDFGLNLQGLVNLSGLSYSGSNTALQALAAQPGGELQETFTIAGIANNLTTLFDTANNGQTSSIQISVATVPEPRFYGMLLCGLLAAIGFMVRRRSQVNA